MGSKQYSRWASVLGAVLVLAAGWFGWDQTQSNSSHKNEGQYQHASDKQGTPKGKECPLSELPQEASDVAQAIEVGGPFSHPKNDGTRFGNYEHLLPEQGRDFYREYTVETPGANNRGARRIITGGSTETDPQVWYYTGDHYKSFCEIPDAP